MKITYMKDREEVTKEISTSVGMTTLNQEWLRYELTTQNIDLHRVVGISDLPDNLTSIGDGAFRSCSELTAITLPPNLTHIGDSAFHGCRRLTAITLPASLTHIGNGAFHSCSGLTAITLPANLTSISDGAFHSCSGLTAITLPANLTHIGQFAFDGCSGLTAITLPASLTHIGDGAFAGCTGLTSITLPASLTHIGASAFYDCRGLTAITLPESLTHIGASAFHDCRGLTAITLPESLTHIGDGAFRSCSRLTAITLPESLTHIGDGAFDGCSALQSGYILVPKSLAIDIERVGIPATTKIIRYDASVHANPIAAVHVLYQRIIIECKYTDPDKLKQVRQHLAESFLKPEQLLKSALKSLYPLRTTSSTIEPMNTIRDYLIEGCRILKGEIPSRTLDHATAQKALRQLITRRSCGPQITYTFMNTLLPMLSRGLFILMYPNLKSPFADQQSLPKKVDLTPPSGGGGGGGGGDDDVNRLTP